MNEMLEGFDMYMSYRPLISYDLGHRTAHAPHHTSSWRHAGAIDRYWYVYRVLLDKFRCFSKRYPSYALRKHMCGCAGCGGRETMNKSYHTLIKYNRYA
jgi:hypothetical protein